MHKLNYKTSAARVFHTSYNVIGSAEFDFFAIMFATLFLIFMYTSNFPEKDSKHGDPMVSLQNLTVNMSPIFLVKV